MIKLALRNLVRQRMRTGITLAAIAIGVASLVLSGGFVDDILLQLREATIHSQLGHLQIARRNAVESAGDRPLDHLIDNGDAVARTLASERRVVAVARRLQFDGLLSNGRGELPVVGEGIEPGPEARIGSAITTLAGRPLMPDDDFAIVIGEGLAKALDLRIGDTVNLIVSSREGAVNTLDFRVAGIFRSLSKEYDARAVRIPLRAAQELASTDGVSALVVLLSDTSDTDAARQAFERNLPTGLQIRTWRQLADFYNSTAALYQRQFGVLQIIILVMVLLSVANSVNMSLHERTGEFGIMRALGRTGRDVFRLAVLETALLGMIGAALGVAVGTMLAWIISAIGIPMPPPPNSESGIIAAVQVVPAVLAAAFGLGLVATVTAALIPARRL